MAYEWNHDPYYYRMSGPPGDADSIYNQVLLGACLLANRTHDRNLLSRTWLSFLSTSPVRSSSHTAFLVLTAVRSSSRHARVQHEPVDLSRAGPARRPRQHLQPVRDELVESPCPCWASSRNVKFLASVGICTAGILSTSFSRRYTQKRRMG